MKLSKHFKLEEFLVSQTAARHGIDMTPPEWVIANFITLCADFLEPIRTILEAPVIISSGYRPQEVNRLIGGSETSDHIRGLAVDFRVIGHSPYFVCSSIQNTELNYDQNIHEFGRWTHLGIGHRRRNQDLTAYKDEENITRYTSGIKKIKDLT